MGRGKQRWAKSPLVGARHSAFVAKATSAKWAAVPLHLLPLVGSLLSLFCLSGQGTFAAEQAANEPSQNLLERIADDYKVIHGHSGLFPQELTSPAGLLSIGALIATDEESLRRINRLYSGHLPDSLTNSFNWLGSGEAALLVSGTLLSLKDRGSRQDGKLLLAAVVDAGLTVQLLKGLTGRERPYQSGGETIFHGPSLAFQSFPSGHASTAFAMAGVLARQHPKQKDLYYALAAIISLGRIHKQKHFLSDVTVGAAIGLDSANRVMDRKAQVLTWRF